MDKIWQLRWMISIILVIISIIIVIFSVFNLFLLLIVPVIWAPSFFILEMMVIPRFKEIEEEEKKGAIELKRYDPIKKIIELLEEYEDLKDDEVNEIKTTQELGQLFPELMLIGFGMIRDTIKDNNYEIHLTKIPFTKQFLIRRLKLGKELGPKEVYYSKGYSRLDSNVQVLNNFIDYLKERLEKFQ